MGSLCPLLLPAGTAVAAAPAGCFVPLQQFGFGHRADLETIGPVVELGSGSVPPAEMKKGKHLREEKVFKSSPIFFQNLIVL